MLRLQKAAALWRQLYSTSALEAGTCSLTSSFGTKAAKPQFDDEDDSTFELLPPGCSMVDPTYAIKDNETTVLFYDEKEEAAAQSRGAKRPGNKRVPATPTNLEAAKKKLEDSKQAAEDEPYVYLPPGSSMKDPGYNSMSDPMERRVYYPDPDPSKVKSS